ncbi:helix-turn-helix transcriptional regulator [Pseudomonas sp. LB3P14]
MTLHKPPLFGERIRQYRRAKGYTQAVLAQRAACNRKTIIDLEAGENCSDLHRVQGVNSAGDGA